IQLVSTAPLHPKATKLTGPDRLVLDLPNAKAASTRQLVVNANEIKDVRMARFQAEPPVTRVVVDLTENRDYELVPVGNKLLVKFHAAAPQIASAPDATAVALAIASAVPQSAPAASGTASQEPTKAAELAIVRPEMHLVVKESAASVASSAASQFTGDKSDTVFDVAQGSSASLQPAMNGNFQIRPQAAAAAPTGATRPTSTGAPMSVNLKDVDLKDFFRLIHEISGLNVVLDPNVHGTLTIVLDDVPWDQALDIVLK